MKIFIPAKYIALSFTLFVTVHGYTWATKVQCHFTHGDGKKDILEIDIKPPGNIDMEELAVSETSNGASFIVQDQLKIRAERRCREEMGKQGQEILTLDSAQICIKGTHYPIISKIRFDELSILSQAQVLLTVPNLPSSPLFATCPAPKSEEMDGLPQDLTESARVQRVQKAFESNRLLVHTTMGEHNYLNLFSAPGIEQQDKSRAPFSTTLIPKGTSMYFWEKDGVLFDIKDSSKIFLSSVTDAQTSQLTYRSSDSKIGEKYKGAKEYYDDLPSEEYENVVENLSGHYQSAQRRNRMQKYNEVWAKFPARSAIGLMVSNSPNITDQDFVDKGNVESMKKKFSTEFHEESFFAVWKAQQLIKKETCQILPIFQFDAFSGQLSLWRPETQLIEKFTEMAKIQELQARELAAKKAMVEKWQTENLPPAQMLDEWKEIHKFLEKISPEARVAIMSTGTLLELIKGLPPTELMALKESWSQLLPAKILPPWSKIKNEIINSGNQELLERFIQMKTVEPVSLQEKEFTRFNAMSDDQFLETLKDGLQLSEFTLREANALSNEIDKWLRENAETNHSFKERVLTLVKHFDTFDPEIRPFATEAKRLSEKTENLLQYFKLRMK